MKEKGSASFQFSGRGRVYSWARVNEAPGFEEFLPYTVALVELDEGPLITAQLTDLGEEKAEIGMEVEMVVRVLKRQEERGPIVYGYKFRPRLRW